MTTATVRTDLYDLALAGERCWVRRSDGSKRAMPTNRWLGFAGLTDADRALDFALIDRCDGPTVDLGCGPGRLVGELVRRGVAALGVDVSAMAVAVTRQRGAPALQRDIFGRLPGTGRWSFALLADGNVGIGGDPVRTLQRARQLLCRDGVAVVEFGRRGSGLASFPVRLETDGDVGPWFPWAHVGVELADELATAAGLRVVDAVEVSGRHVVRMAIG
ncbi:class I SAM-dependent methyltransferase [Antrihabitans cavernicola]|uniref:SAM-dependent methyltransferase n=1 Tax=Antrihabitans cavernicola TaxID=2495913 RepID=A0A5A7S5U5_9NOCA|nr:class I SAM-dependent methyltransferase [Spelaeibacter cavernicola]KAA0021500.1 SAM-dependent methyltransferase [Spelaeibacter cavernicola]